jgi:hypothetical protein
MSTFNLERSRKLLQKFDFHNLFIEELGWEQPAQTRPDTIELDGHSYSRRQIAQLAGVVVFELTAADGQIPEAKIRARVQQQITEQFHENLLIFVDAPRSQSVWYWVKRDGNKRYPRSHHFVAGQTGDLFLSKIKAMVVDMAELDEEGNIPVVEVASRMKAALDIERVTKKFFDEFQLAHTRFLSYIRGIPDERERRWYTSVILNRVMFIWFLQTKHFIDGGDTDYLQNKLAASRSQAAAASLPAEQYYPRFLQTLFFEGFAKPEAQRDEATKQLLGRVKYLNGGLFLPHPIEEKYGDKITIPDAAFDDLYSLFDRYSWSLDDSLGGQDDEINPDVLGHIFEKYINQKEFGAYYTRPEITEYLCEQTIHKLILDRLAEAAPDLSGFENLAGLTPSPAFESIGDVYTKLDAPRAKALLFDILPSLSLLDPAAGSGAFLVAALKTLVDVYQGVIGRIEFLKDGDLTHWLAEARRTHPSLAYFIKKRVITQNLYGVDIMAEAVEIARLRLFLALVAAARTVDDLEPLPNIDFNILPGNSLIGLLRVDEAAFNRYVQTGAGQHATQLGLFAAEKTATYHEIVAEKKRLVAIYKDATTYNTTELQALRDNILAQRHKAHTILNKILLDEFQALGIQFEQATWDAKKNKEGKPKKRPLTLADIEALQPFHWGYEFDAVMNEHGGFDAIITNPPWEIFKPQAKEFFADYSSVVTKNKMTIQEFEKQQKQLLKNPAIQKPWLEYLSRFPHQNRYFKESSQYQHQQSVVNGRKVGSDTNMYKLFVEQCFNLLRSGGDCGIVIPSGIYTDLGAKGLRTLLFEHTLITGLFGFENRRMIFEGVDSRFKFVVLSFKKDDKTQIFPAIFMRHDVIDLTSFPGSNSIQISVNLIRSLQPDSHSITEFRSAVDVGIANKLAKIPLLSGDSPGWKLEIYGEELHMNRASEYFYTQPTKYPLYEGNMFWHFDHQFSDPRYWIKESELRDSFLQKRIKRIGSDYQPKALKNDYQTFRLAFRKIASSTNERTLVTTILPKNVFVGNSAAIHFPFEHRPKSYNDLRYSYAELLVLCSLLNSYVTDYTLRLRMTTNLNTFYLYQLPVPRLTAQDPAFAPIVERAAKLICTTPEFDDLAAEVGLGSHANGVTDPAQRAQLRAELDGLIAHVYGLTEAEFGHILSTFPLVGEAVKAAALAEYRRMSFQGA